MSKFVNVANGNYNLTVQPGGTITMDTGVQQGQFIITGDLQVQGDTTFVSSANLTIQDNIIVLNQGETGAGVSLNTSGIRIDRGTLPDALLVFDETITYNEPVTQTIKQGAFKFKDENNDNIGFFLTHIATGGSNLNLINQGTGVINVSGTADYENQVQFDDDIPNRKFVVDRIKNAFLGFSSPQITSGDTVIKVSDISEDSTISQAFVDINGQRTTTFFEERTELFDVMIKGSTISSYLSNSDLVLESPGTGSIRIDDTLHINSTPGLDDNTIDPAAPTDGVKIYAKAEGNGNTGIYYVNSTSERDELISRNRSLLYGMLF